MPLRQFHFLNPNKLILLKADRGIDLEILARLLGPAFPNDSSKTHSCFSWESGWNWWPCIKSAKSARSKVKSLWQLHSSYMKALGAFNSQLLSSGTNTANGVNRVSRPQTSEATCGGFKEWADCSGSILRKLKRCSLPILRYLPWSSLLRGPKRRWKIL